MDYSFVTTRRKQKGHQRTRVAPMDVDFNDTDDSWLNHPFDHQLKQQQQQPLLEQENEHEQIHSTPRTPVFSDKAPFTFTMAPPPAADDSNNHRSGNDRHYHDQQMAADDAVRSSDRRPISPKALRKIYSRRQRQKHRERRSSDGAVEDSGGPWMTESEEEDDDKASNDSRRIVPQQHQHQQTSERLQMHRDLPYVISGYLQLGFNVFMVGTVLVIVVNVLLTIRRDVNAKVQAYSAEILHEIAGCTKQYADNQCDPLMRVPAMEPLCAAWESCMHRDPTKVGRAKVSAETLAEIVNGFIDPISFKTMLFFVLLFVGTLLVSNFAFGAYRQNRVYKQHVRRKQHVPGIQQQQQLQQLQLQSKRPQAQQNANQSRRRRAAGALPPPPLY
ncbi:hypothetical protein GGI11_005731 [Coemansia sp. RSA 2049]|nr:hypothetical protein GGI11_005731 [Coemansia sp. RSA 2049]